MCMDDECQRALLIFFKLGTHTHIDLRTNTHTHTQICYDLNNIDSQFRVVQEGALADNR